MAAEIESPPEITGCKHDISHSDAEHIIADQHEILRRLHAFDELLTEFRPLIERARATGGGTFGLLRGRAGR